MIDGFTIFGIEIKLYAVMIVTGMICGAIASAILAKRRGFNPDILLDMLIAIVPLCIIGARLYYVVFELDSFHSFWDVINIRSGGLAIYGGIIGGAIGVFIVCKIRKLNFVKMLDFTAPGLILGQVIGRWGNFFNQEAYGNLVTNPKFFGLPWSVFIESENAYFQATFLYESLWNFIGFILLFIFAYKYRNRANGLVVSAYFIWYGIGRTFIEGLRSDSLYWGAFRVSQVLSVLLVIASTIWATIIIIQYRRKNKLLKEKKDEV